MLFYAAHNLPDARRAKQQQQKKDAFGRRSNVVVSQQKGELVSFCQAVLFYPPFWKEMLSSLGGGGSSRLRCSVCPRLTSVVADAGYGDTAFLPGIFLFSCPSAKPSFHTSTQSLANLGFGQFGVKLCAGHGHGFRKYLNLVIYLRFPAWVIGSRSVLFLLSRLSFASHRRDTPLALSCRAKWQLLYKGVMMFFEQFVHQ